MQRINVRVDERLKQQLEAEAREKGVSPSDIVREAPRRAHHAPDAQAKLSRHRPPHWLHRGL